MGNLIYHMMISLDGYMETLDHSLDWHAVDEELHVFINDLERTVAMYLLGRRSYQLMEEYWPNAHLDPANPPYMADYAHIWRNMPKVVFSRTLEQVGMNARLVRENIFEEVARLKAETPGDISIGGAETAVPFIERGLVDEYRIFISPIVLGNGIPAFRPHEQRANLRLLNSRVFSNGVVYLQYVKREE